MKYPLIFVAMLFCFGDLHALEFKELKVTSKSKDGRIKYQDFSETDEALFFELKYRQGTAKTVIQFILTGPDGQEFITLTKTIPRAGEGSISGVIRTERLWDIVAKSGRAKWKLTARADGAKDVQQSFFYDNPFTVQLNRYLVYKPSSYRKGNGLLIVFHPHWNRNRFFYRFMPICSQLGLMLMEPQPVKEIQKAGTSLFSLKNKDHPVRADIFLIQQIDDVVKKYGVDRNSIYLYGLSGGGQFTHRFILAHPGIIKKAIPAGPSFWTFPDPKMNYIFGIGKNRYVPPDVSLDPRLLGTTDILVLVGEKDNLRDDALTKGAKVDLQGFTRLERSAHWVNSMNSFFLENKIGNWVRYIIIPGASHGGTAGKSPDIVKEFIQGEPTEQRIRGVVSINGGEKNTASRSVTLAFRVLSEKSPARVAVSDQYGTLKDFHDIVWKQDGTAYTGEMRYILPGPLGNKFIYVQFMDADGELSDPTGEVITLTDSIPASKK